MTKQNAQAPASLDNIKPLLKELLNLTADKKDMEKEIAELRKRVLPVIEGRGKLQVDNYIVEAKVMQGRKSVDKEALNEFLKQHGKSIEDFEKQGAPYPQLNMSEAAEVL